MVVGNCSMFQDIDKRKRGEINASECNKIGNYLFLQKRMNEQEKKTTTTTINTKRSKIEPTEYSKYDLVENVKHATVVVTASTSATIRRKSFQREQSIYVNIGRVATLYESCYTNVQCS